MTTRQLHSITCQAISATLLVLLLWGLAPDSAQSAIYKCIDPSGNTTYTGTPCEPEESSTRISGTARALPTMDCRVLVKLADETAQRMLSGESSADMIDSYGGMNQLSGVFMEMLSYIYTFKGNTSVTPERIADLSADRCRAGSFGAVGYDCAVYPPAFIEKHGGCAAAQNVSVTAARSSVENPSSEGDKPSLEGALPDEATRSSSEDDSRQGQP